MMGPLHILFYWSTLFGCSPEWALVDVGKSRQIVLFEHDEARNFSIAASTRKFSLDFGVFKRLNVSCIVVIHWERSCRCTLPSSY